ncbi:hypothetical protein [Tannerella forsythia]|uniref:hypothetical protein n=1 Tax=Tannerella forsythia TaxID=28112 RepID=UPI000A71A118|nr:hypothetical protein [Tannerella forsythia]
MTQMTRINANNCVCPCASGGEPTEQRAGRKKIRLSKRSELPDFPTCKRREACEAYEALTFWLLLGQAKSDLNDKKEILRFAKDRTQMTQMLFRRANTRFAPTFINNSTNQHPKD